MNILKYVKNFSYYMCKQTFRYTEYLKHLKSDN
jgi:hypothetical protein